MGNARARGTYAERVAQAGGQKRSDYVLASIPLQKKGEPIVSGVMKTWKNTTSPVRSWRVRSKRPRGLRSQDKRARRTKRDRRILAYKAARERSNN